MIVGVQHRLCSPAPLGQGGRLLRRGERPLEAAAAAAAAGPRTRTAV